MQISNFTVLDSVHGKFIVNRHCDYQAESLIKTGRPHIEDELEKILLLLGQMEDGCVVVDAGANIGLVAIPMAQALRMRGGVVHAFEAQRMICYALCGAVALNDLENLIVRNQALGAAVGMLAIGKPDYGLPQDFGQLSLVDQEAPLPEKVEVVTIDSLRLARLDFLKIDVEGMEVEVLKGAHAAISRHRPWCWIEYGKTTIDDIKARFDGLPYGFYIMDSLNMLCAPMEKLAGMNLVIKAPEA